jgi:hypothetical protein
MLEMYGILYPSATYRALLQAARMRCMAKYIKNTKYTAILQPTGMGFKEQYNQSLQTELYYSLQASYMWHSLSKYCIQSSKTAYILQI